MGKWIPVSKELPPEDTDVIVCDRDGLVSTAMRKSDQRFSWAHTFAYGDPVAWMPLPEGYTGEEAEEPEKPEECKWWLLAEALRDESKKNVAWLNDHNFGDCKLEYSMRLGREEVLGKVMSLLGVE